MRAGSKCRYGNDEYPSNGSKRFTIEAKQSSTTSSLRSCVSRPSVLNLSMAQKQIAPMTIVIRMPIMSEITATPRYLSRCVRSLPSALPAEKPTGDRIALMVFVGLRNLIQVNHTRGTTRHEDNSLARKGHSKAAKI